MPARGRHRARWGGDEFIILVPDFPGERQAAAQSAAVVIEKIREALPQSMTAEGQEIEVSTSIGVALYPWDGANVVDLIKHADTAMYQAKGRGRNTYQFFTEAMHTAARARLILENDLRRALRRSELAVHYQPQVQMRERQIVGAEALVRWRHPERGWISPAEFIPIAEESGQIQAIGLWVVEQVLAQMKDWRAMGVTVPRISVNVSPYQLTDPALPAHGSGTARRPRSSRRGPRGGVHRKRDGAGTNTADADRDRPTRGRSGRR